MPSEPEKLRSLPGVGRYTAGAVASIAFDVPAPLVDGNVARVLARLFGIRHRLGSPRAVHRLWELADALVPVRRPGEWNQALMELGARVCTARSPRCDCCPVRRSCAAFQTGSVRRIPVPAKRPSVVAIRRRVVIVEREGRVLLVRRTHGRFLRGLYEFPEVADVDSSEIRIEPVPSHRFRHTIMNRRIETEVVRGTIRSGGRTAGAIWMPRERLARLPLSAAATRIARNLLRLHAPARQ